MAGRIFILSRSNYLSAALTRNDVCTLEFPSSYFAIYSLCICACEMLAYAALVNIHYALFPRISAIGVLHLASFGVSAALF